MAGSKLMLFIAALAISTVGSKGKSFVLEIEHDLEGKSMFKNFDHRHKRTICGIQFLKIILILVTISKKYKTSCNDTLLSGFKVSNII